MFRKVLLSSFSMAVAFNVSISTGCAEKGSYIPKEYQDYCIEIGEMYGVCPELLMAMIEHESSGNPTAKNGNCKGLMQVSDKWHKDRMNELGVEDICDPYGNILVGADYLMELAERYGDIGLVLMKYNGFSNAEEYAEQGKLNEYAESILERSMELEVINGK